jgi:hypothetical protein
MRAAAQDWGTFGRTVTCRYTLAARDTDSCVWGIPVSYALAIPPLHPVPCLRDLAFRFSNALQLVTKEMNRPHKDVRAANQMPPPPRSILWTSYPMAHVSPGPKSAPVPNNTPPVNNFRLAQPLSPSVPAAVAAPAAAQSDLRNQPQEGAQGEQARRTKMLLAQVQGYPPPSSLPLCPPPRISNRQQPQG